jgi:hypothetical protein
MKADGEYRVWFQIRDLNPASDDEGTEAWFASVRTSPRMDALHNIPVRRLSAASIRKTDGSLRSRADRAHGLRHRSRRHAVRQSQAGSGSTT